MNLPRRGSYFNPIVVKLTWHRSKGLAAGLYFCVVNFILQNSFTAKLIRARLYYVCPMLYLNLNTQKGRHTHVAFSYYT